MTDDVQPKKLPPGGDTARRVADAVNFNSELQLFGQFQVRLMADLASEDATLQRGRSFYVPDESGGPCIVVSNGVNWKRLTLGATAS